MSEHDDTTLGDDAAARAHAERTIRPARNAQGAMVRSDLVAIFASGAAWQRERDAAALREAREHSRALEDAMSVWPTLAALTVRAERAEEQVEREKDAAAGMAVAYEHARTAQVRAEGQVESVREWIAEMPHVDPCVFPDLSCSCRVIEVREGMYAALDAGKEE